ncbi:MAG: diacylglycerol kinase family protein, partial [Myxococcota bacterium]|nr:diacylglycerol kinase family protein [Myxococcota bacterium]
PRRRMSAHLPALAIVNPTAGGGATHEMFRRAEHPLLDRLGELDVVFTERKGHAEQIARDALRRGVRRVLVAGGDGTISETVNAWIEPDGNPVAHDATLHLLCGGTGGDLRRTLGISDLASSLAAIDSGRTLTLDVGKVSYTDASSATTQRYFINVASLGLGALVDQRVGKWGTLGSRLAYTVATAEALLNWRNPRVTLEIEGPDGAFHASLPAAVVAVANGQFFGGGMRIAPDANPEDGLFHVTVLGDLRRREIVSLAQTVRAGDHLSHKQVMSRTGTRIKAFSDTEVRLDIDGEAIGRLPAEFQIVPSAVRIGVP